MQLHEVKFPVSLSFGSVGGPERRTDVVALTNGFEERNTPWAHSRRRYDAGLGLRALDDLETLIAFFEATIADLVGPMSLDVADIDMDGDIDIVAGEHNLKKPKKARLYILENVDGKGNDWKKYLVYTGDEHHDGARVVDIDNDGDFDIISIGWSHNRVLLYENRAIQNSN